MNDGLEGIIIEHLRKTLIEKSDAIINEHLIAVKSQLQEAAQKEVDSIIRGITITAIADLSTMTKTISVTYTGSTL